MPKALAAPEPLTGADTSVRLRVPVPTDRLLFEVADSSKPLEVLPSTRTW